MDKAAEDEISMKSIAETLFQELQRETYCSALTLASVAVWPVASVSAVGSNSGVVGALACLARRPCLAF